MTSTDDKTMEEAAGQKRKLTAQSSFDEEMDFDGFSELDKLDPSDASSSAPQQTPSTQQPLSQAQNQPASVPPQNGNPVQNGVKFSTPYFQKYVNFSSWLMDFLPLLPFTPPPMVTNKPHHPNNKCTLNKGPARLGNPRNSRAFCRNYCLPSQVFPR
jgi:hypothetical protein